jgi:hypothetical protein
MSDSQQNGPVPIRRRWYEDTRPNVYVVVDLKCDGGDIRRNSLRSMASVAVLDNGAEVGFFARNVAALEGCSADLRSMALFREHLEAWRANTDNPERASTVIRDFVTWVKGLPGQPILVATPMNQTAIWLDHYLRRFTSHGVYQGPYINEPLFYGPGIDITSLALGATGLHYRQAVEHLLPPDWRGNREETHDVRQDVLMHADVLFSILKLRKSLPTIS